MHKISPPPAVVALSLIIGIISCTQDSSEELNNKYFGMPNIYADKRLTLKPYKTIEIKIDSSSLPYSYYPVYFFDGKKEYYITGNEFLNSIDMYDLDDRVLYKRTKFPKEGGDMSVFNVRKIFVKNLDSLYIYDNRRSAMLLIDKNGSLLRRYNLPKMFMMSAVASQENKFLVDGNTAYISFVPNSSGSTLAGQNTLLAFLLDKDKVVTLGAKYNDIFKNHYFSLTHYFPRTTFQNNHTIITRFGQLSTVYKYDIFTDKLDTFQLKSKYQSKPIAISKANSDKTLDEEYESIEKDAYAGIFYDKYNHVYYSIFSRGIPRKDLTTGKIIDLERVGELKKAGSRVTFVATKQQGRDQTIY